jgi:hypothetical protein
MNSNGKEKKSKKKRGVDALLLAGGRTLQAGQSFTVRLVKGPPTSSSKDPVDPKAPAESFPLIAKFPVSVVKPDFSGKWRDGRFYQQDVPKPQEDSDEETSDQPKKKWRYLRHEAPARQWILQEQVEFLETMVARREKRGAEAAADRRGRISSRYEGAPEGGGGNSRYVVLSAAPGDGGPATVTVRHLPTPNATVAFQQPAARKTMTLTQAEQAIHDQRAGIRAVTERAEREAAAPAPNLPRMPAAAKATGAKSRLLGKLKTAAKDDDVEEGDDVMADVTFSKRKGGGAARNELFSTMADGLLVGDDGVLGGSRDEVFGGRQKFASMKNDDKKEESQQLPKAVSAGEDVEKNAESEDRERGADGAAMEDDFYQRDVGAEYDELDYDANEQFDDDDVDVGETEVVVDDTGFGPEGENEEEAEADEMEEEAVAGAAGLATVAGFKAMLAKARGEVPAVSTAPEQAAEEAKAEEPAAKKQKLETPREEGDHISKIMAAAEKSAAAAKQRAAEKKPPPVAIETAIQVDENGLRVITLEAVRREIWLNQGSISMKRLMKIFNVKKKSGPERQNKFREIIRELCNIEKDPVSGHLLVLKQHYSRST